MGIKSFRTSFDNNSIFMKGIDDGAPGSEGRNWEEW